MLHLHFSNRIEILSGRLLDQLRGTRDDVFTADTVVIPHSAAQRHLSLALATRDGIAANLDFVYLAHWLWQQVARVLPGVEAESPFDQASLTWRVYTLLREEGFVGAHPSLATYLATADGDPLLAYELASTAASLMEQYITFRPDWLAAWKAGRRGVAGTSTHEGWQAAAWERISADLAVTSAHPMEAMARALAAAGPEAARRFSLPAQVRIFALSSIPPLYLTALQSLALVMEVHVFALNPCREFWFDLVDPRQLDRLEAAGRADGFEVGHRLLSSWGQQAQASLALLTGIDDSEAAQSAAEYQPAAGDALLGRLQDSILELRELEPGSIDHGSADRSIEVHVCHSLTRELEALHDHLLGLFAADPSLKPSDILVVTPDLEAAAPLVEAVFGTAPEARRIPFATTGRKRSSVNAPVKAFLAVLSLAGSRCTATDMFAVLQQAIVSRRFGLDEEDLQQVHDWMIAAGIHWGLDREHVAAQRLPAEVAHTLADGVSRLFLGYALPDGSAEPFAGQLATGEAEGSGAAALGALWRFSTALKELATDLAQPRTPALWAERLHAMAADFLAPGWPEMEDWLDLQRAIDTVAAAMERGGFEADLSSAVMRAALESVLDEPAHGGAPTGRVTFTGMNSLRNLPFRVVCAVGMNDGAFPTADRPPEFDLMAASPRLGDRQRRTDQRTLFLDLLLAARDSLYLSYTGRSIRDNAPLPPSVLVAELLDVLVPAIAADPASEDSVKAAHARLVWEHPLQPFSAKAFNAESDDRIRSHDTELAEALRASLRVAPSAPHLPKGQAEDESLDEDEALHDPAQGFFPVPLAPPAEEWREVPLQRLVEFFSNPSRYLLQRRLRIDLPGDAPALADDEPFLPDFEGRARLADRLLPHLLDGTAVATVRRLAEAGTELPAGALGAGELENELASMARFAGAVRQASADEALPPLQGSIPFSVEGEEWQLDFAFADLRPAGLVRWRYDDERATDVLRAWLHHLALCAASPAGTACRTTWIARDGVSIYEPLEAGAARARLLELLGLYRRGLAEPLRFFPKSSLTFILTQRIEEARKAWSGGDWGGESVKPGYALALRGVADPLAGDFQPIAAAVLAGIPVTRMPLLDFEGIE